MTATLADPNANLFIQSTKVASGQPFRAWVGDGKQVDIVIYSNRDRPLHHRPLLVTAAAAASLYVRRHGDADHATRPTGQRLLGEIWARMLVQVSRFAPVTGQTCSGFNGALAGVPMG